MKIGGSVVLLIFLVGGFVGWVFWQRIGNVAPAILPPISPEEVQPKKAGEPLSFPLQLPPGFQMGIFAQGLNKARDLQLSEGGTLLLSLTDQGKVVALPDKDQSSQSDEVKEVLSGLDKPHGLAFLNNQLFVAEETKVSRYKWDEGRLEARFDKVLFPLPSGGSHFTRSLAFDSQGRLFVALGSTCNVCFEKDERLAAVIVSDAEGKSPQVFAKGLRNAVFLKVHPQTGALWATEMGRDFLGDNKPPDEINILQENQDYGWPLCFGNKLHDTQFDKRVYIQIFPQPPCGSTQAPVWEIPAHSAPLGLVFINSLQFPGDWQGDLLVAYHGSWNSSIPVGYKVVRLKVKDSKITGEEDFISGFLQGNQALGRPVDLEFDKEGSLYISDDKAGTVYKIIKINE